ncbi:MAG: TIGR01841 family phasin [Pseudomonadota bacterium]
MVDTPNDTKNKDKASLSAATSSKLSTEKQTKSSPAANTTQNKKGAPSYSQNIKKEHDQSISQQHNNITNLAAHPARLRNTPSKPQRPQSSLKSVVGSATPAKKRTPLQSSTKQKPVSKSVPKATNLDQIRTKTSQKTPTKPVKIPAQKTVMNTQRGTQKEQQSQTLNTSIASHPLSNVWRNYAEQILNQTKSVFEKTKDTLTNSSDALEAAMEKTNENTHRLQSKIHNIAHENLNRNFDHFKSISEAKNIQQAFELQADFIQQNLNTLSQQAQEFQKLSSQIVQDAAHPITTQVSTSMQGIKSEK